MRKGLLGTFVALCSATAIASAPAKFDIAFEEFKLDNGLTVIVHEDRKTPVVAISAWYHVGAKDEPTGKTGFAHLFEHLMFYSEHHPEDHFVTMEKVGATAMNGTTDWDRTNYFENVPTSALDVALWIQSDRMGHTLGAVTQKLLDQERGIVQNEKRQSENQPYGLSFETLLKGSFPEAHPYRRTVIGSMDDLNAASLTDVQNWFKTYYGPSNAIIVLAGDIDVATAKAKMRQYFGHIPPGPPLPRIESWVAKRSESSRASLQDRVPQPRLMRAYNVPEFGTEATVQLDLLADILGGGKSSRLYQRLIEKEQVVDRVQVSNNTWEIAGLFVISADLRQGVDSRKVEAMIDEEIARLLASGPTAAELARARMGQVSSFVRAAEFVGGFGGKAVLLAQCRTYTGDAGCFREQLGWLNAASVDGLKRTAQDWLAGGDHTLLITPMDADLKASTADVDRSKVPDVASYPDLRFPELKRATLNNGMKVILAERHQVPIVNAELQFDAGVAADYGAKAGLARFTLNMLDEGAGERDAKAIAERVDELGARLGFSTGTDVSSVSISALGSHLDPSLDLFADLIQRPRFDAAEIDKARKLSLSALKQEQSQGQAVAQRVLPLHLYPSSHAYAGTATGDADSLSSLSREDLLAFQRTWLRPDRATLLVVGDITMADLMAKLEARFGGWRAQSSERRVKSIHEVAAPSAPRVLLVDKPGAIQAHIAVAQLQPDISYPERLALSVSNQILAGDYLARVNSNLRIEKSWTYGAYAGAERLRGQTLWTLHAPVQIDKTIEAIAEIKREIAEFKSTRPATEAELARVIASRTRSLPGELEGGSSVLDVIAELNALQLPETEITTVKARTEALTLADVRKASDQLQPNAMVWFVHGDLSKIEAGIRALNLGTVQVVDVDGKVLR